jgi:UDP-2,3-diacylglucosamine hydrolase
VYHNNQEFTFNGKTFFIGHGDGKGPGDKGYKRMKKLFTHSFSKWLFNWLHPDIGVKFAQYLSVKNKLISGAEDVKFLGKDNEWLVQYCNRKLTTKHYDFFVFGHRHLPLEIELNASSKYINLGDWISYFTYGVFDGESMTLKTYTN